VSWAEATALGLLVRPLSSWPGPMDVERTRRVSPFTAPWRDTASRLGHELGKLGARTPVLEVAVAPADFRRDGYPRAAARADHPGVVLSLPETVHGPLRYFTDEFDRWQDNVRAIALSLEALRKVDRYGVARRGEQYRGWTALPSAAEDQLEHGRRLIREAGGVSNALKRHHPDHGGDAEDVVAILAARDADAGGPA
jgi:hypothetical protein